jgi:hypothetical protein
VLGSGTGFFYTNARQELFLITNRHVVIDETRNFFPNTTRLLLHDSPTNLRSNRPYDVPLYVGSAKNWRETTPVIDLIAIPLNHQEIDTSGVVIRAFSASNLIPRNVILDVGEDVLIIGYPLGVYFDEVNNLPVIRSGIIASAYPFGFQGHPYFLVDARLHKGTSGSPVLTKPKSMYKTTEANVVGDLPMLLIGVNAATFPIPEGEEPLGLNAVFFASILTQLTA